MKLRFIVGCLLLSACGSDKSDKSMNESSVVDGGIGRFGVPVNAIACSGDEDCTAPETTPEECAEALCVEGYCHIAAKDDDGDGFTCDKNFKKKKSPVEVEKK